MDLASEGVAQVTKMSSRGQVVIPEEIRDELELSAGSLFAVYGRAESESILLKKLELPEPTKAFEEMAKWGEKHAKARKLDVSPKATVEKVREFRRKK